MSTLAAFLAHLDDAKTAADVAETAYRTEAAARGQALTIERAYAYRRADLMTSLAQVIADAADPDIAAAAGQAMLRARLGWDTDTPAREEVLTRFATVAAALHAAAGAAPSEPSADPVQDPVQDPAQDPVAALAAFEAWYLSTRETPFWYLFDHYVTETPLVDF